MNTYGLNRPLNSFGLSWPGYFFGVVVTPTMYAELVAGIYTATEITARIDIAIEIISEVHILGDISALLFDALNLSAPISTSTELKARVTITDTPPESILP